MSWTPSANQLPKSVRAVLEKVVEAAKPKKITLFGSRARGNHRTNSDFDIAVTEIGCSPSEWARLSVDISEGPLSLHQIDLMLMEELDSNYKKEISNEAVTLYEANT